MFKKCIFSLFLTALTFNNAFGMLKKHSLFCFNCKREDYIEEVEPEFKGRESFFSPYSALEDAIEKTLKLDENINTKLEKRPQTYRESHIYERN